jgi:hypothetical protein
MDRFLESYDSDFSNSFSIKYNRRIAEFQLTISKVNSAHDWLGSHDILFY